LPAAIVNGGGDRVGKVQFLELHRRRDLDLESGHTACHRASLIDLYVHTKFHWNRKNFFLDRPIAGTPPSSRSRDTKTRTNFKNPVWSNL